MVRARRLASIAIGTVLAVAALTGCRSNPEVAAYVGSAEIPDAQVTRVVDEVLGKLAPEQREGIDEGALRDQVVHLLVLRAVVDDYAKDHDLSVPDVDANAFAQEQNLPAGVEFTKIAAEYNAGLTALSQQAKSVVPTEADQREAYGNTTVNGERLQEPFSRVRQYFDETALGQTLGMRRLLDAAVDAADVTVNPRYDAVYQLPVQIQGARSWFAVDLGGSAPVRDAPAEAPASAPSDQGASGQE